jgi:class 3 adenylate cyclase
MAAGGEVEAHEGVARLQQRQEHRLVGLRAGIGLHIGEAAAEQLAGALDGELLGDVDELAAAIVAAAGIALGIFVGHHRALRLQHGAETMFSEAISSISSRWRPSSDGPSPRCRAASR